MEQDQSPVNVTVSGSDAPTVRAVTGVMASALQQSGFENVRVGTPDTEPDPIPDGQAGGPSLLDLVQAQRPHLFRTPVNMTYLTTEVREERVHLVNGAVMQAVSAAVEAVGPDVQMQTVIEVASADRVAQGIATIDGYLQETEQHLQRAQDAALEAAGLSPAQEEEQEVDIGALQEDVPADRQMAADLQRYRTEG